ncbi:MAG: prenyltransferase/squalene oxidase repeat-containing protein [Isosphaeraceae bacterium]
MRPLPAGYLLLALSACATAAEPSTPPRDVKTAIRDGLDFLAQESTNWKQSRACATCHHTPMAIWALNEAKKLGYTVDDEALTELSTWVVAKDDPAKLYPKRSPSKEPDVNQAPLLLALGFEAGGTKAMEVGLKRMLSAVIEDQREDGSWRLSSPWRPIGSSPEVMTTLALLALTAPNAPDLGEVGKAASQKGLKWLEGSQPGDDPQAVALLLLLWKRLGREPADWSPLVDQIRKGQNSDGGWGQAQGARSDAFATGQALYALMEAGIKPGDDAIGKAQAYLTKTQGLEGSWPMDSRPNPRDGKPAKNVAPITSAGSAWAVMGLARSAGPRDR